jgi:hypothetical protein
VIVGAVLAFDIGGVAGRIRADNPLSFSGGRWMRSRLPNPARLVGWLFFIIGMLMLVLAIVLEDTAKEGRMLESHSCGLRGGGGNGPERHRAPDCQ